MRQFEIKVENKIGSLAEVCDIISKSGVNITAIATEDKGDHGIIKVITENEDLTRSALTISDMEFKEFEVVPVRLRDQPGELAKLSRALANLGIDVQSVFVLGKDKGTTEIVFKVDNLEKARELLE
ncbi:MAG: ACT domain-containing protein [Candidatus Aenigmatarchaeota archaeon]